MSGQRERDERFRELDLERVGVVRGHWIGCYAFRLCQSGGGPNWAKHRLELVDRRVSLSLRRVYSTMAATTTEATRSLYRSFWRGLALVARTNGARTANLRRLYRPQLRHQLLLSNTTDHAEIRQTSCVSLSLPYPSRTKWN